MTTTIFFTLQNNMSNKVESYSLPSVPSGWEGENNFKSLGKLSTATQRNIEPVGAHFLAEARRVSIYTAVGSSVPANANDRNATSVPSPRMTVSKHKRKQRRLKMEMRLRLASPRTQ